MEEEGAGGGGGLVGIGGGGGEGAEGDEADGLVGGEVEGGIAQEFGFAEGEGGAVGGRGG